MINTFSKAQSRFLAGLFTNLAAGWLGVAIITPGFGEDIIVLLKDIVFAILFSWIAIKLEELQDYE